jgi:hypothetical protein
MDALIEFLAILLPHLLSSLDFSPHGDCSSIPHGGSSLAVYTFHNIYIDNQCSFSVNSYLIK